jgi:hypothetical protein
MSVTAPPDWLGTMRQRIFYDPHPASGEDCSLRAYYHAISYGRAWLEADVFDEVSVATSHCGAMQDEAISRLPAGHSYERACVVFPAGTLGGACAGWAFFGLFPGTSDLRAWCYVAMDAPLGVWAMELLHILTGFGDLYNPINPATPSPGDFDVMDCACGTHPSAFTKQQMGWLDPTHVPTFTGAGPATYTLHALGLLQPSPPGRVVAVKVPSSADPTHYYLVEARLRVDRFERPTQGFSRGIPSEGVVVYEIDEMTPPLKVWLRTPTALSPGQVYENPDPTERLAVEAGSRLPGGFSVTIQRQTDPPECATLLQTMRELEDEIAGLQADLGTAAPGEKPRIVAAIRSAEAN